MINNTLGKIVIILFTFLVLIVSVSAVSGDTNGDGCVSFSEVSSYVAQWLLGQVTLTQVSSAVTSWLAGCTNVPPPANGSSSYETGIQLLGVNRGIDWSHVGVPGGIPNYPVSSTLSPSGGDDKTAIQNALNSAPQNTTVLLTAGQYTISGSIKVPAHRVIRGSGVDATVITCTGGNCFSLGSGWPGNYVSVASGYNIGSTQITVANAGGFTVGQYGDIRQDMNANTPYFTCGYDTPTCPSWGADAVGQMVKITAINGNTLTLDEPLYFQYSGVYNPRISSMSATEYAGVENLKVTIPSTATSSTNFGMQGCAYCWIKNVWSENAVDFHVDASHIYKCEIRDSVFNGEQASHWGVLTYGIRLQSRASTNLIENNIINHVRHSMVVEIGPSGNVFGYDYSDNIWSSQDPKWLYSDIALHGHYPTMNLYEGNVAQLASIDNVWGTHGPNTLYRNRILRNDSQIGDNSGFSYIGVSQANPYQNIIGNDLGFVGQTMKKSPITLSSDIASTILVDGNYVYPTGQVTQWDPSLPQQLPASLYHTTKPDWWDNTPWPAYGPDSSHTANGGKGNMIPAWTRYLQLKSQGKII